MRISGVFFRLLLLALSKPIVEGTLCCCICISPLAGRFEGPATEGLWLWQRILTPEVMQRTELISGSRVPRITRVQMVSLRSRENRGTGNGGTLYRDSNSPIKTDIPQRYWQRRMILISAAQKIVTLKMAVSWSEPEVAVTVTVDTIGSAEA